ncbi:MAG: hypothetical protein ACK6A9_19035 [Dolichospermum sp.]
MLNKLSVRAGNREQGTVLTVWISSCLSADTAIFQIRQRKMHLDKYY